jgi:hypothetical protein
MPSAEVLDDPQTGPVDGRTRGPHSRATGPYAEESAPRRDVGIEVVSGQAGSNPAVGAAP